MKRYKLISKWKEVGWTKKEWDKTVTTATKEAMNKAGQERLQGERTWENMEKNKRSCI